MGWKDLPTVADATTGAAPKAPKGTALLERRQRRIEDEKALAEAYADVDARDGGYCVVTGRYTQFAAPDARVRREHHHLAGRNVKPEWRADANHIVTVCAEAHQLITGGFLVVEGTDARKPIRFHWAEHFKGAKPFEIRSRRWSQQRAD